MNDSPLFNLTYGMFVLTSQYNKRDNGCIVDTLIQVADKKVAVTVNKMNLTHDYIQKSHIFNASILTVEAQYSLFQHWGFNSGRNVDKTVGIDYKRSTNGLIYLIDSSNAYISAKVRQEIDLGTHTMFIADMVAGEVLSSIPSMSYAYYQEYVKKSEANKGWICTVCGYVYDKEELNADFICPICKHPAADFIKR
ncbi:MAG: flavin reductase [Erysipelotrichia bacterium]|nr:flavin reductase [Erysipelotrichia bacterium]